MTEPTNKNIKDDTLTTGVLKARWHTERKNKRAVVFVHGFTGDWDSTWRSAEATFPNLVIQDPEFGDFDVFAFQYRSKWWRGSPIQNLARQLRDQIGVLQSWAKKNDRHYELVFLTHSMGGLVCMRYILDCLQDNEIPPIAGLLLYGVPTTGTELVKIARLLGIFLALKIPGTRFVTGLFAKGQRQVADLETASNFLQGLHAEWAKRVVNGGYSDIGGARMWLLVRVVTGEDDWVVSEASGKGMYGAIDWHTLAYGHVDLVKPADHNDPRYQPLQSFLRRCRDAKSQGILDKLWDISRSVWKKRETKLIRHWKYRLEMFSDKKHDSQQPWIESGFAPCTVSTCEYIMRLNERTISVAAAIGNIATRKVWEENPVYVHQINVDALPENERDRLIRWIDSRHQRFTGEDCWRDLFPHFMLKVVDPDDAQKEIDLDYIKTVRDGRGLVRQFALPEGYDALVGEEVQIRITYDSMIPAAVTSFRAFFPWLTDGCDLVITVNGSFGYFVAIPQALDESAIKFSCDQYGHRTDTLISSKELLLPDTAVVLRWRFS